MQARCGNTFWCVCLYGLRMEICRAVDQQCIYGDSFENMRHTYDKGSSEHTGVRHTKTVVRKNRKHAKNNRLIRKKRTPIGKTLRTRTLRCGVAYKNTTSCIALTPKRSQTTSNALSKGPPSSKRFSPSLRAHSTRTWLVPNKTNNKRASAIKERRH